MALTLALLAVSFLLLAIPSEPPPVALGAGAHAPFEWREEALFERLEKRFREERRAGCIDVTARVDRGAAEIRATLATLDADGPTADDARWPMLESKLFELSALVAACQTGFPALDRAHAELRRVIKNASIHWEPDAPRARTRLYRTLYGARAAVEEAALQVPAEPPSGSLADTAHDRAEGLAAIQRGTDEPTGAPTREIHGVPIASGDLLVSRGGASTSALIARGNDYPGNFSHVAVAHIDEEGTATAVEAHIERGLATATVDEYLRDKKLRILVLRPRADLPELAHDPRLPHRAATRALAEARRKHVPYDFAMNWEEPSKKFCSEVAYAAYFDEGLRLWEGLSSISGAGTRLWLSQLGVERFDTLSPSDLEYDPKLRVVAEFRDREALFFDHVDGAVVDAMLERADRGVALEYEWFLLPFARLAKLYSLGLNAAGRVGPVPEGMPPEVALRVEWFRNEHAAIKARVLRASRAFRKRHGYVPPYWELTELAEAETRRAGGLR